MTTPPLEIRADDDDTTKAMLEVLSQVLKLDEYGTRKLHHSFDVVPRDSAYLSKIPNKRRISIGLIREKVQSYQYADAAEFLSDWELLWQNTQDWLPEDSVPYKDGAVIIALVRKLSRTLFPEVLQATTPTKSKKATGEVPLSKEDSAAATASPRRKSGRNVDFEEPAAAVASPRRASMAVAASPRSAKGKAAALAAEEGVEPSSPHRKSTAAASPRKTPAVEKEGNAAAIVEEAVEASSPRRTSNVASPKSAKGKAVAPVEEEPAAAAAVSPVAEEPKSPHRKPATPKAETVVSAKSPRRRSVSPKRSDMSSPKLVASPRSAKGKASPRKSNVDVAPPPSSPTTRASPRLAKEAAKAEIADVAPLVAASPRRRLLQDDDDDKPQSVAAKEVPVAAPAVEESEAVVIPDKVPLTKMKKAQLVDLCEKLSLSTSGTISQLVERLLKYKSLAKETGNFVVEDPEQDKKKAKTTKAKRDKEEELSAVSEAPSAEKKAKIEEPASSKVEKPNATMTASALSRFSKTELQVLATELELVWNNHFTKVQMVQLIRRKAAEGSVSETPAKAARSSPKNRRQRREARPMKRWERSSKRSSSSSRSLQARSRRAEGTLMC